MNEDYMDYYRGSVAEREEGMRERVVFVWVCDIN
jgi:hypothetical protein